MHCFMLLAGFLATLIGNGLADEFIPGFISPENSPNNPVYTVGDSIAFEWVGMSGTNVGVIMWQQSPEPSVSGGNSISLLSDSSSTGLTWKVSRDWLVDIDDDETAVAFLALYQSGSTSEEFRSHSFNISAIADASSDKPEPSSSEEVTSSTAAEEEPTSTQEVLTKTVVNEATGTNAAPTNAATTEVAGGATTAALTASDTSSEEASSSTSKSSPESPSDSTLSTEKIAGIVVGLIVSIISALGGISFVRRRKKRAIEEADPEIKLQPQQQSSQTGQNTQSTHIHILQPVPAPSHSAQPPKPWNDPPVQSQSGHAPPPQRWTQSSQQVSAEMGDPPEYRRSYGHGNSGVHEAP
ncbi:hypothetical protein BKA56DRAFT_695342 [Ilyonectria sp. MPI-CAGE-AT-0026]|nr:hypothetical protein BKA56DRAFT_695342 [Ilyonectria sp. MPI-CAGE-AT-0026]